jgi:hypothetical protein
MLHLFLYQGRLHGLLVLTNPLAAPLLFDDMVDNVQSYRNGLDTGKGLLLHPYRPHHETKIGLLLFCPHAQNKAECRRQTSCGTTICWLADRPTSRLKDAHANCVTRRHAIFFD